MTELPDLDSRENIELFVDRFYEQVLSDPVLAPIFMDVAGIELQEHLGHIKDYWGKLLLGDRAYRRHTMNIHRALHTKRELQQADFMRWLRLFQATVDEGFTGSRADRAKRIAATIAENMQKGLSSTPPNN